MQSDIYAAENIYCADKGVHINYGVFFNIQTGYFRNVLCHLDRPVGSVNTGNFFVFVVQITRK